MKRKKKIFWIIIIFIFILFCGGAVFFYYCQHCLCFNLYIGGISLKGTKIGDISGELNSIFVDFTKDGFVFKVNAPEKQRVVTISPFIISHKDPDLTRSFLSFDLPATEAQIRQYANPVFLVSNLINPFAKIHLKPKYFLQEELLLELLKDRFSDIERPPQQAEIYFKNGQLEVSPSQPGFILEYKKAVEDFKKNIESLNNQPIVIDLEYLDPGITEEQAKQVLPTLRELFDKRPVFGVQIKEDVYKITPKQIVSWLGIKQEDERVIVELREDKIRPFLEEIAQSHYVPPLNAKFVLEGNKVKEFQVAKNGFYLDIDDAYNSLKEKLLDVEENKCILSLKEKPAEVVLEDVNSLGIKELVGKGESNFAGSPPNRIHNIKVGVEKIKGTLIAPNEEFSLVQAIGEVSDKTGFLPELVIKGDRTIPEYGGGLCQLGTTAFRVALNAGLPITERVPHSYRVPYYEPAGMDATIYQPHPDLRFINDTDNYLLLEARINGYDLIFELYGTKDGREVVVTEPVLEDIIPPPPPKEIFTDELAPGERKKIESAHSGAKASFKRIITFPNGLKREEVWRSYYVPWPEVWLVGKEKEDLAQESGVNKESENINEFDNKE